MGSFFSASEVIKLGIQIEINGMDYYNAAAAAVKSVKAKEIFVLLAGEETKHKKTFEDLLSQVEKREITEAYPGEFTEYLKVLAESYVFTKPEKGKEAAEKIKNDFDAVDIGVGFEKDSILMYQEMKEFAWRDAQKTIDFLVEQEKIHFVKLSNLRKTL